MNTRQLNISRIVILFLLSILFISCNGVGHLQMTSDSTYVKGEGYGENPEHHSGGPGDSASGLHRTDSSRVIHGGELINGSKQRR